MSRFSFLKKLRLFDFLFIFLTVGFGIFLCVRSLAKQKGSKVIVNAAGKEYEYSAKQNGIYKVHGALGITEFEIKDGKVRIIESPCPNKTCINQGWHSPIVCLPNNVIISIESDDSNAYSAEGEFDAVSE